MKHITFLVFALSLCAVPIWEETSLTDYNHSASAIQSYSGIFSYTAFSPVYIEADGFVMRADSGSLKHDIEINVSKLPYKSGTLMPSNMENVCHLSDGVRLLPNGQHFSDSVPALI